MTSVRRWATASTLLHLVLAGCAPTPPQIRPTPAVAPSPAPAPIAALAAEQHLADLRQLTFGGENAEAYWSWSGTQLIFQARPGDRSGGDVAGHASCDRIYRMELGANPTTLLTPTPPAPIPVSDGRGATTCSYFLPGDRDVIFASTGEGDHDPNCPPRPDHSQGYVWALYDTFDIYRAHADGSGLTRLTSTPGYDAEGTVCQKDGSIVFTSTRDGDIDLYRMDADGKNVRRLTNTPGYDGGAFFSPDCSKIVWRASRPQPGKELDDFRRLLHQGLVRPTKLELFVANADGSEAQQVTYLNAASFGPYWFPSGKRIIFASNYGDPKGREFDLWAVDVDGTHLERITYAGGFDGFPMFSPDGKYLAFSSNRATPEGLHDTNMFVARWVDSPPPTAATAADRIRGDIAWLADPQQKGRGLGTPDLVRVRDYLVERLRALGLAPAGDGNDFGQRFSVTTQIDVGKKTALAIGKTVLPDGSMRPLGFSSSGAATGKLLLANYGIVSGAAGLDDYAHRDARGKIVVVRRFAPDGQADAGKLGDLRQKAWMAREHGAVGLVVVDWPASPTPAPATWQPPADAPLPELAAEGYGDAGIPVVAVTRAALAPYWPALTKGKLSAQLTVELTPQKTDAWNVVGRIPAGAPENERLPGVIVIGAHYDHLGMGGRYSLAPDRHEPHLGADDNASGTASLLEIARALTAQKEALLRDVLIVAFSAEESGVLGSSYFVRNAQVPSAAGVRAGDVVAMLNLDMVGRMRDNHLSVLGADSATEWPALVEPACRAARVDCTLSGDGYGPSDQLPFYSAGVPVLFFFTGAHADYHKPSDTVDRINAAGAAQSAQIAAAIAVGVARQPSPLRYVGQATSKSGPLPTGDTRQFNAGLGTIPDYAGPPHGQKGMLVAGVRKDGAADLAGLRRGDIVIQLGTHAIANVEDLMYALAAQKPGDHVNVVVVREQQLVTVQATLQESHR